MRFSFLSRARRGVSSAVVGEHLTIANAPMTKISSCSLCFIDPHLIAGHDQPRPAFFLLASALKQICLLSCKSNQLIVSKLTSRVFGRLNRHTIPRISTSAKGEWSESANLVLPDDSVHDVSSPAFGGGSRVAERRSLQHLTAGHAIWIRPVHRHSGKRRVVDGNGYQRQRRP